MKEKISIIMPIYNAEKTLNKSIESILKQTYKNLEIILVNDGSIDTSLKICEYYKSIDPRIIIINKQNSGVGDSRNKAIDISTGDYISFIDADDMISENYIEELYRTIKEKKCDYVTCNIVCVDGKNSFCPMIVEKEKFPIYEQEQYMEKYLNFHVGSAVWGKLYSRKIIGDIRFEKTNINEDFIFTWEVLKKCKFYSENGNASYFYHLDTENSLTKKHFSRSNMNIIDHIDTVLTDVSKHYPNLIKDANNYYSAFLLHTLILYNNYINSENCTDLLLNEKEILVQKAKCAYEIKNHFLCTESSVNMNNLIDEISEKTLERGKTLC